MKLGQDESHLWTDAMTDAVRKASETQAGQRERLAERVARSWLPRPLRWLARHPRALRAIYAVRPHWRPTVYVGVDVGVDGDVAVYSARMKDGTSAMLEITTQFKVGGVAHSYVHKDLQQPESQ